MSVMRMAAMNCGLMIETTLMKGIGKLIPETDGQALSIKMGDRGLSRSTSMSTVGRG